MFNPSREEVRGFFIEAWAKHRAQRPLVGLETVAVDVMLAHPEHRDTLENSPAGGEREGERDCALEQGETSPFLHLSLHLAIEEQLAIDQPPGVRAEVERLSRKLGERHAALHAVLECLGEAVWRAQREGAPPAADAYLECMRRK